MTDIELIEEGLVWLSDHIEFRDETELPSKGAHSYAVRYANNQSRIIRRILDYVETQEDGVVIVLRKLLELDIAPHVQDIALIAATNHKGIEEFEQYEQLLIGQVIFGKGTRWKI